MRGTLSALLLVAGVAAAQAQAPAPPPDTPVPACAGLIADLRSDPSSVLDGSPLLGVDELVADNRSTAQMRFCTGIARYRDATTHITFTAKWVDAARTKLDVNAHATTPDEAEGRGRALRAAHHPKGSDGTFALVDYTPDCSDPDFLKVATNELQHGISAGDAFYLEPGYTVLDIAPNGPTSGILANCVATVGDAKTKGQIFIGTNWVDISATTIYQFYILEAGPEGFKLANRLWDLATE